MLTSNERKDYILRMIAELRRLVEALMGKVREKESGDELLAQSRRRTGLSRGSRGTRALRECADWHGTPRIVIRRSDPRALAQRLADALATDAGHSS